MKTLLLVVLLATPATISCQALGASVTGTIADSSGAPLAGSVVTGGRGSSGRECRSRPAGRVILRGHDPVRQPERPGPMTEDELFVTAEVAAHGVTIENLSESEPLVILKHFGPGNPDADPLK